MRRPAPSALLSAVLLLGAALAAPLGALETSSPDLARGNRLGAPGEPTLKPLFLFSMRGRRDPFVPYARLGVPATDGGDIDGLQFAGTLGVGGSRVALFMDSVGKTYTLRGGRLYDPEDRPVAGVRGALAPKGAPYKATLSEGEHTLSFSDNRPSKRLDASGQP